MMLDENALFTLEALYEVEVLPHDETDNHIANYRLESEAKRMKAERLKTLKMLYRKYYKGERCEPG